MQAVFSQLAEPVVWEYPNLLVGITGMIIAKSRIAAAVGIAYALLTALVRHVRTIVLLSRTSILAGVLNQGLPPVFPLDSDSRHPLNMQALLTKSNITQAANFVVNYHESDES